jgi:hypothetical protein
MKAEQELAGNALALNQVSARDEIELETDAHCANVLMSNAFKRRGKNHSPEKVGAFVEVWRDLVAGHCDVQAEYRRQLATAGRAVDELIGGLTGKPAEEAPQSA